MTTSYAKACTEVLEILKYLPEEEYNKIPKEKIESFERNKDKEYVFKYNPKIDYTKQNISEKTSAIIITLFRDYFATDRQKNILEQILAQNDREIEEEKKKKYAYENIFKDTKKEKIENSVEVKKETELIEIEEKSFIKKIFSKIKRFFSKKEE